jgi:hypothetical protein
LAILPEKSELGYRSTKSAWNLREVTSYAQSVAVNWRTVGTDEFLVPADRDENRRAAADGPDDLRAVELRAVGIRGDGVQSAGDVAGQAYDHGVAGAWTQTSSPGDVVSEAQEHVRLLLEKWGILIERALSLDAPQSSGGHCGMTPPKDTFMTTEYGLVWRRGSFFSRGDVGGGNCVQAVVLPADRCALRTARTRTRPWCFPAPA